MARVTILELQKEIEELKEKLKEQIEINNCLKVSLEKEKKMTALATEEVDYQTKLNESLNERLDRAMKIIEEEVNKREAKHNERNAGRKERFTAHEKEVIKMYRIQGKTIREIADLYSCSPGLIHKVIKEV